VSGSKRVFETMAAVRALGSIARAIELTSAVAEGDSTYSGRNRLELSSGRVCRYPPVVVTVACPRVA
jgi:hypothetical protein